jgi:hypothetical protein
MKVGHSQRLPLYQGWAGALRRALRRVCFGAGLALVTSVCEVSVAAQWPGESWDTATPAEVGMDEALLEQARDHALLRERMISANHEYINGNTSVEC